MAHEQRELERGRETTSTEPEELTELVVDVEEAEARCVVYGGKRGESVRECASVL